MRTTAFGEAVLGRDGLVFIGGAPPDLPPPGDGVRLPADGPGMPRIAERVEHRRVELPGWIRGGSGGSGGGPTGEPSAEFWLRFADGWDPDLLSLLLLVDAAPPPVLDLGASSTTIQLTVHLRAPPASGWLACRAITRFVSGGYHEEDLESWDAAGTLVAQSRQLALLLAG